MATEPNGALTGAAFDLANAGYAPMPDLDQKRDEETIGSDGASLREAAERRSAPRDEIVVREYRDAKGEPIAANEAITLERAGRDYARATAADRATAEEFYIQGRDYHHRHRLCRRGVARLQGPARQMIEKEKRCFR